MKNFILGATALSLLAVPAGASGPITSAPQMQSAALHLAQYRDRDDRDFRFRAGERLPRQFRDDRYAYYDWRESNLQRPPRGYRWMLIGDEYVLASIANGTIRTVVPVRRADYDYDYGRGRGWDRDREERWRARYHRTYALNDDAFYRECRNQPDPAGALVGAVIGGLLGNAAGNRRNETATTIAGVIAGGAIGAALTNKLDCEDRSYAYKTYTTGFNAGRANAFYDWQNPQSGARGRLHVLDYYNDEDGFRCTVYSQTIYIGGRPEEARGRACQQPDGAWAIID